MVYVKKIFNVFGIILAWLLSIALVILLVVSPIVTSALSLLDAETITKAFANSFTQAVPTPSTEESQPSASNDGAKISRLSNVTEETTPTIIIDIPQDGMIDISQSGAIIIPQGGMIDMSQIDLSQFGDLSGILGENVTIDEEVLNEVLNSNVAKELIEAYTEDLTNAFVDGNSEPQFNEEKIKEIVSNNADEIVDILQKAVPELSEMERDALKEEIFKVVDEGAGQIVEALPKAEDIKQELVNSSPELEMALQVIALKDTIQMVIVGILAVLSVLIFLCRLCGFRGFRWLATDFFIAGFFGLLICFGLTSVSPLLTEAVAAEPIISGLVNTFIGSFISGMWLRVGAIILAGIVCLVAYILIKKLRKKPVATIAEAAAQE